MIQTSWTTEQTAIGRIVVPPHLPPGFALFCTTRDFPGRLDDDRARELLGVLRERFGVDAGLSTSQQVHGAEVLSAGSPAEGRWCEESSCDALVTRSRGVAIGVKIADCLPVTILDSTAGVVGGIHSGWRGAAGKIVPAALEMLLRDGALDVRRARAFLGPSIRGCCFEVGEEVIDALRSAYGAIDDFIDRMAGAKPHVDLPGLTRRVLTDAGLDATAIDDSGLCSRCDGSIFHSFRRDGVAAGRNLSIAAIG